MIFNVISMECRFNNTRNIKINKILRLRMKVKFSRFYCKKIINKHHIVSPSFKKVIKRSSLKLQSNEGHCFLQEYSDKMYFRYK